MFSNGFYEPKMIFDLSRTTLKTENALVLYTRQTRLARVCFLGKAFRCVEELPGRALSKRCVLHEQLLLRSRIQSTVAIHFELCRQLSRTWLTQNRRTLPGFTRRLQKIFICWVT